MWCAKVHYVTASQNVVFHDVLLSAVFENGLFKHTTHPLFTESGYQ